MTADVLPFVRPDARPRRHLHAVMPIWSNPDCDSWCPGGHGIPGEDHSHSMYVRWDLLVGPQRDWLQVGIHRNEGEPTPRLFLHRNDACTADDGFELDLTLSEAAELIRELRTALKTARKGKRSRSSGRPKTRQVTQSKTAIELKNGVFQ